MSHTGSVFELSIEGAEVRCRILLEVLDPLERRVLPDDSPLRFFQEALLIQVLESDGRPAGVSFFTDRVALEDGEWRIVDQQVPRPEDLEFPVYMLARRSEIHVVRGEVSLLTDISSDQFMQLDVLGTQHSSAAVDLLAAAQLGLPMPRGKSASSARSRLSDTDLRLHEEGARILADVGQGIDEPYHVFSKRHGFDPARLLG